MTELLVVLVVVAAVLGISMFRTERKALLQPGQIAPDFVLPSQTGEAIRLYDLLERGHVVLYFYVQDYTPG